MGTFYKPISIFSVVARTLEKFLLPYSTANITQTPTQDGYKSQHSTVTALHTSQKGFNQMTLSVRTITVALDTSKAFDTVNIHTLIGTIIKFIANTSRDAKPILLSKSTNLYSAKLKLAFLKAATYHPPYLTPIQQIFQHSSHRYK